MVFEHKQCVSKFFKPNHFIGFCSYLDFTHISLFDSFNHFRHFPILRSRSRALKHIFRLFVVMLLLQECNMVGAKPTRARLIESLPNRVPHEEKHLPAHYECYLDDAGHHDAIADTKGVLSAS